MLTLPRPHRQIAATVAILLFMVIPTILVGAMAWRVQRPGYLRAAARELGLRLGSPVSLEAVRYPRPGEVEYRGFALRSDDAGELGSTTSQLASAAAIRISHDGRTIALETEGLVLRDDHDPDHALEMFLTHLQQISKEGTSSSDLRRVTMLAPTCEVKLGPRILALTLRDLAWTFQPLESGLELTASYHLAEPGQARARGELTVRRKRDSDHIRTRVVIGTSDDASLPGRVLDLFFSSRDWLGKDSKVRGQLEFERTDSGPWEARFRGCLDNVDLTTLASRIAPSHQLSGTARITIDSARWAEQPNRGSGWVDATGSIVSTSFGTIGHTLLAALQTQLGFQIADALEPGSGGIAEFQAMGLSFRIDEDGLIALGGALGDGYRPDAVLIDGQRFRPLAFAPAKAVTVPGVVRTLASAGSNAPDTMIPARIESILIQRFLPAPTGDRSLRRAEHSAEQVAEATRGIEPPR